MSEILEEISSLLQKGRAPKVKAAVQQALDQGIPASTILQDGLLAGMDVVGAKFKNNEVFVPEVLVAARAMNKGVEVLRPYLVSDGVEEKGVAVIGTVKGDMHDIGKNLVKIMMEGSGIEVIDLGVDTSAEEFVDTAVANDCGIIACSSLLTTTMQEMRRVVELVNARGLHDRIKIMIGGAPITQGFCDEIGADSYTPDAAAAARRAVEILRAQRAS